MNYKLTMLGLMKNELNLKNIPWGYELCFNNDCALRQQCMHYQASLLNPSERTSGPAVYPTAWAPGDSARYTAMCLVPSSQKPAVVSSTTSAAVTVLTIATIMVRISSRPVSRRTSCRYCPNMVLPTACPSTTM